MEDLCQWAAHGLKSQSQTGLTCKPAGKVRAAAVRVEEIIEGVVVMGGLMRG